MKVLENYEFMTEIMWEKEENFIEMPCWNIVKTNDFKKFKDMNNNDHKNTEKQFLTFLKKIKIDFDFEMNQNWSEMDRKAKKSSQKTYRPGAALLLAFLTTTVFAGAAAAGASAFLAGAAFFSAGILYENSEI